MKKLAVLCLVVSFVFVSFPAKAEFVSAKSAIVISADTGEVLYSHNSNERLPMASTTKIMTALLVCEAGELSKKVEITKEMIMVEGTSMGLSSGDVLTREDLLYGMLLISGNDAANALAVSVGGSLERFVAMMNERAKALGLKNTGFATPSGLDGEGHFTSAYDLAIITKEALMYNKFAEIVSTETKILSYGDPPCKRQLINHNKLLKKYSDIIGVKTGFTKKSGRCLVTAAQKDGKKIIAVTLNDKNDWEDHRKLLDLGFSALKEQTVSGMTVSLPVINSNSRLVVEAATKNLTVSKDKNIEEKLFAPRFLYSPVKKGETVGRVEYYIENDRIGVEALVADRDIKAQKNVLKDYFAVFTAILRSINEG